MLRSSIRTATAARSASSRALFARVPSTSSSLSALSSTASRSVSTISSPLGAVSRLPLPAPSTVPALAFSPLAATVVAPLPAAVSARAFSADACSTEKASVAAVMQRIITESFSPVHLAIEDTSGGCGAFFRIVVVSPAFEGKRTMARHRAVQGAIAESIKGMHGLTLMTHTPAEWEALTAGQ